MKRLVLTSFILISMGCGKVLFKDDELTLEKRNYNGSNLKLSGYFYYKYPESSDNNTYIYSIYFLYNNGVIFHPGATYEKDLEISEIEFKNGSSYNQSKGTMYKWGVYEIENDILKIEKWYPSSGGPMKTYIREGNILNDSTFVMSQTYRLKRGKKKDYTEINETYHFKLFSPKPDSTNEFIN